MSGRDFDGFTVVITGASTGLGRAIAVEVARRGAGLVVVNYASSADGGRGNRAPGRGRGLESRSGPGRRRQ